MASPCLCKPPTASEPTSRVKPVLKQTFGRASREAAREALPRAVPNGAEVVALAKAMLYSWTLIINHGADCPLPGARSRITGRQARNLTRKSFPRGHDPWLLFTNSSWPVCSTWASPIERRAIHLSSRRLSLDCSATTSSLKIVQLCVCGFRKNFKALWTPSSVSLKFLQKNFKAIWTPSSVSLKFLQKNFKPLWI